VLRDLESGWKAVALLTFNSLILILVANFVSWVILALAPQTKGPEIETEALLDAYPGFSEAEIRQIQSETWSREYDYEPFTQFKEGAVFGDFVNVDENGFRRAPKGSPWPPDPAATSIYVFGGSTTFGYGLDDAATIPVALQRHLRSFGCSDVTVYNLARSNYFSTQERILFEQLLLEAHVPSAAVFIDGLNEFVRADGKPKFSGRLAYFMAETRWQLALRALKQMPLARLLQRFVDNDEPAPLASSDSDRERAARMVLERWNRNRQMIRAVAEANGVSPLFVWQPVPVFPPGSEVNPFLRGEAPPIPNVMLLEMGYELEAAQDRFADTLWLADLGRHLKEPLYVDRVHYSAAFSSAIASRIAEALAPQLCFGTEGT
jgi:hypothetical protein